ncbi:RES family NAD+ phosphorylase [Sphingobium sp. R-7]|uniref:RES family NAD+ phosphorylase n=1 Tax=Sphingobium sp. R-7 TaxID=3375449 RepID=UPI00398ABD3E
MVGVTLRRIKPGTLLHRIHRPDHGPIFFGPESSAPTFRFDAPDGSYKVLYAARALETAFAETLVRSPHIPYVISTAVKARVRSELAVARTLRLYPLIDAGVSTSGLSFTDLHGDAYSRTQEVSAWVHGDTSADGILYTSRFDNQRCVALFDRAIDAVVTTTANKLVISPAEATALSGHFGKTYVEP